MSGLNLEVRELERENLLVSPSQRVKEGDRFIAAWDKGPIGGVRLSDVTAILHKADHVFPVGDAARTGDVIAHGVKVRGGHVGLSVGTVASDLSHFVPGFAQAHLRLKFFSPWRLGGNRPLDTVSGVASVANESTAVTHGFGITETLEKVGDIAGGVVKSVAPIVLLAAVVVGFLYLAPRR